MGSQQKQNLILIIFTGAVYFLLFFWPNGLNAADEQMLRARSQDEAVTYPYVLKMLSPSGDIHETWGKLIIYGDYHYGYPFYFLSLLVLLPVRLIFGEAFTTQTQLNLLLLRQFISVLPMVIGVGVMVYLQTRFKSLVKSFILFAFMLGIGGVFRNNLNWWHPDALAVLAIVLTLFFLDRDQNRFGRSFYLAAVCCGLATAIKMSGVFFAPAIAVSLLVGWIQKRITLKRMVLSGSAFILIMSLVFILANPFLFYSAPRQRFFEIQSFKSFELSHGYTHDDPTYYQTGPYWWHWTLEQWYGHPIFWGFCLVSLLFGCWKGKNTLINRFILLWTLPYSIYLLYFVVVKPDHYWLPVVLPFFSVILNIPMVLDATSDRDQESHRTARYFWGNIPVWIHIGFARKMILILVYLLILIEWFFYLRLDTNLFVSYLS